LRLSSGLDIPSPTLPAINACAEIVLASRVKSKNRFPDFGKKDEET